MFSPEQLADLLAMPFFAGLQPATFHQLQIDLERVHLPGGALLFAAGAAGDSMYVVLSGRLRVSIQRDDGNKETVRELARGDTVGELALLTGEARSASVRAIRDTRLVKISRAAFESAVKSDPQLLGPIAVQLAGRERQGRDATLLQRNLRTIAVVPVDTHVSLPEFTAALTHAMKAIGATACLRPDVLSALCGLPGAPAAARNSVEHLATLLNHLETNHRFVLYEADPEVSEWTELCLRQADLILLVGAADRPPEFSRLEIMRNYFRQNQFATTMELVLLHHPQFITTVRTSCWRDALDFAAHHHVVPSRPGDIARLVRTFTGTAVGLVLSGGGARGFAHIGVIRALTERQIPIDFIGGTSMGAVIAAQHALGWDWSTMAQVNRAEWPRCHPQKNYTLPLIAINSGNRMDRMLTRMLGDATIDDLRTDFFCVSTNLTRAEAKIYRQGSLWKAVRASVSIPGIGPPTIENGEIFVDGGLVDNLPVAAMKKICQGKVFAVDVSEQAEFKSTLAQSYGVSGWKCLWQRLNPFVLTPDLPNILNTLYRTTTVAGVRAIESAKAQADLCFEPPVSHFGVFDWRSVDAIVDAGYRYALDKLDAGYSEKT